MLSFWETQSFLNYDYIIIGSGMVGLSTAISLRERNATASILILERGIFPTGASTKNAGFACIGSLTEILEDLKTMPEKRVLELVEMRWKGLAKLRARLGDTVIDYREEGSFELLNEKETSCLSEIEKWNQLLFPILHKNAFEIANEKINQFGFDKTFSKHLISNNAEGQLDTGKMMKALLALALSKGIEIKTGAEVSAIEEKNKGVDIVVFHSHLKEEIRFHANKLVLCTNAFSQQFFPDLDLQPGRGHVLMTTPIADLKVKGIFHFDKGYYYFRNFENRILFGGGRNLDFEKETSTVFELNQAILEDLKLKLQQIILPNLTFEIEQSWTGIMAFGKTKYPILKKHSENITIGVRMGGMGVAIGSQVGEVLAELVVN